MNKLLLSTALCLAVLSVPAMAQEVSACLITKTDTNPFFVKMREGAEAKAAELGITLKSYAGKVDGDHETQVAAIETCIADGAKGILITASDTSSIVQSVQQARDAGLLPVVEAAIGKDHVIEATRWTASEDFPHFAKAAGIPSVYFFVGATPAADDASQAPANHSPKFFVDEAALPVGTAAMTRAALDFLGASTP